MSDAQEMLAKGLGKRPKEVYLSRGYIVVFEREEDIWNHRHGQRRE